MPAGQLSRSSAAPSAGKPSPLRWTASRDAGGPWPDISTIPRCARRLRRHKVAGSPSSRGFSERPSIRATAVCACRYGMRATTPRDRAPKAGPRCRSGCVDAVRLGGAMTPPIPPAVLLDDVVRALAPAFRLDQRVAAAPERTVYHAWDRVLKRSVALHVHLVPDSPGRAWFLRETETLAALDHPTIRHVSAAALVDTFAYRTANLVAGRNLPEAQRPWPR